MSNIITLPELGENIENADIVSLSIKVGDTIKKGDILLEVETGKATVDIPADVEGIVEELFVKVGDKIKTGQSIASLLEESQPSAKTETSHQKDNTTEDRTEERAPQVELAETSTEKHATMISKIITLENLGNVTEGVIIEINVKEGDVVDGEDTLLELEMEKATVEIPIGKSGTVKEIYVKKGETVKIGQKLILLKTTADKKTSIRKSEAPSLPQIKSVESKSSISNEQVIVEKDSSWNYDPRQLTEKSTQFVPAAPIVRRFAREIGVNVKEVQGTGNKNRISIDDVKKHSKKLHQKKIFTGSETMPLLQKPLPDFTKWGEIENVSLNNIKQATAIHMQNSWSSIPHVTNHDEANVTALEHLRQKYKVNAQKQGIKLTMTAIITKFCVFALKTFPQFNASYNSNSKELIHKKYYHIGVAVNTPKGLLVPVLRNVNEKTIFVIAKELGELSQKTRDNKVNLADLEGGTFTISNLGSIAGNFFTPIINWPEVAILGIGKSQWLPRYNSNSVVEKQFILPLSLSYDHRVIDGAEAAQFLAFIVEALEEPFSIFL